MGIINWLVNMSPAPLVGLSVFAMLNFLVADKFIARINIANLPPKAAKRNWLIMIGSFSLLFGLFAVDVYNSALKSFYEEYAFKRHIEERLEKLTEDETSVLSAFVQHKNLRRCWHRKFTGALKALERDSVIYQSGGNKKTSVYCYNIERWAYFYLLENPNILKPNT